MRRSAILVVVLAGAVLTGCGPASPDDPPPNVQDPSTADPTDESPTPEDPDDDGASVDDYCSTIHDTSDVTAETTGAGVVVGWWSQPTGDPVDFVVYRRPVGDDAWQRVADVSTPDGDEMTYVDTTPAEEPGTAYEYTVTRVEADCGGESEICAGGVCDPAPSATPRQD